MNKSIMSIFNYDKSNMSTLNKEISKHISEVKLYTGGLNLLLCQSDNIVNNVLSLGLLINHKFSDSDKRAILCVSFYDRPVDECKHLVSIMVNYGIECFAEIKGYEDTTCNCLIKSTNNSFPDILYVNMKSCTMTTDKLDTIINNIVKDGYSIESIILNDITELIMAEVNSFPENLHLSLSGASDYICTISKKLEIPFIVSERNICGIGRMSSFVDYMLPVIEQSDLAICVSDRMECCNDGTLVTKVIKNRS